MFRLVKAAKALKPRPIAFKMIKLNPLFSTASLTQRFLHTSLPLKMPCMTGEQWDEYYCRGWKLDRNISQTLEKIAQFKKALQDVRNLLEIVYNKFINMDQSSFFRRVKEHIADHRDFRERHEYVHISDYVFQKDRAGDLDYGTFLSQMLNDLKRDCQELENKLCDARGLLLLSAKDVTDRQLQEKIQQHYSPHMRHRLEEQGLLIDRMKQKIEAKRTMLQATKESSISVAQNLKILQEEQEQLEKALKQLEAADPAKPNFLDAEETMRPIERRFNR